MIFEGCGKLYCFINQHKLTKISPAVFSLTSCWTQYRGAFDNISSCRYVDVGNLSNTNSTPLILPNPGGKESILKLSPAYAHATLTIIDTLGRKCVSLRFSGKLEVAVGQYLSEPGVYYYSVEIIVSGERLGGHFVYR